MLAARALAIVVAALALAAAAEATPIQPDLKKLMAAPPRQTESFVPARAGWNGPEMAPVAPNPMLQYLMTRRPVWQELAKAAVPDVRLLALLALAVLLLRFLRRRHQEEKTRDSRAAVVAFPREGERKAA